MAEDARGWRQGGYVPLSKKDLCVGPSVDSSDDTEQSVRILVLAHPEEEDPLSCDKVIECGAKESDVKWGMRYRRIVGKRFFLRILGRQGKLTRKAGGRERLETSLHRLSRSRLADNLLNQQQGSLRHVGSTACDT